MHFLHKFIILFINIIVGRATLPFSVVDNLFWTNKACILTCHKLKSFLPSNFTTSNFIVISGLITCALIPVCCVSRRFNVNNVNWRTWRQNNPYKGIWGFNVANSTNHAYIHSWERIIPLYHRFLKHVMFPHSLHLHP